jgi:hypothetical protein
MCIPLPLNSPRVTQISNWQAVVLRGTLILLNCIIITMKDLKLEQHFSLNPMQDGGSWGWGRKIRYLTEWGLYGCSIYLMWGLWTTVTFTLNPTITFLAKIHLLGPAEFTKIQKPRKVGSRTDLTPVGNQYRLVVGDPARHGREKNLSNREYNALDCIGFITRAATIFYDD